MSTARTESLRTGSSSTLNALYVISVSVPLKCKFRKRALDSRTRDPGGYAESGSKIEDEECPQVPSVVPGGARISCAIKQSNRAEQLQVS